MESFEEVARFFRQNEVGRRARIETPYGRRLLCYGDLTATGRYLHFVEAWVRQLRPYYANTHTAISSTGRLMTELREEARRVIERSVNAAADDVVLFVGSGATAALNKLVGVIGLRIAEPLEREHHLSRAIPAAQRPVVLVGPYEHHSNELPWIETVADVVEVGLTAEGTIDLGDLERRLAAFADRPLKIGAFSAASNVTGVLSDVRAVARILHAGGAWAVFDYAAAAPYVPIDMHPPAPEEYLDAIVMSVHKFVGGPQSSGVLVANRSLFRSRVPERPGGGTVDYVAGPDHASVDYSTRIEEREEGGTPAIVGDIRAGIAFLVKDMIGPVRVVDHDTAMAARAQARLARHPRISVLGPTAARRLAILSFNIEGLHHDLVSALLDHLFGIQNRAGCACAGPYGHRLLGIDGARSDRYRREIARGNLGVKPGWVRLTLPYYASDEDIDFMLTAVEFIADHGINFVPCYRLGWCTGVWCHVEQPVPDVPPLVLTVEALSESAQSFAAGDPEAPLSEQQLRLERAGYLKEARALAHTLEQRWQAEPPTWNPGTGRADLDELVWFRYVHTDASAR
jgi:selenocysteine lyase/cysteine desulfurase